MQAATHSQYIARMTSESAPAIPWQSIDTVLLDLDGTLLDLHFDNHFFLEHLPRRLAERRGIETHRIQAELHARYHHVRGTLDWYCLDYWEKELGVDIVALKNEIGHLVGWRPHAPDFLDALGTSGRRRVLATNAHPASMGFKFERLALAPRLEACVTAHDLGAPKESPIFWENLHALEGIDPQRTLFVDDNPVVLAAARAWGLVHVLGIRCPDSRAARNALDGFVAVDHLECLLNGAGTPPTGQAAQAGPGTPDS